MNYVKLALLFLIIAILTYATWYMYPIKDITKTRNMEMMRSQASLNYKLFYSVKGLIDPSFSWTTYAPYSEVKIDVVIPLIEKDLELAPYTIDGIRDMVMHPIGKIYIIAPESQKIRKLAQEKNCEFVLEDAVIPNYKELKEQGGWFIQQFLKLSVDRITEQDHVLIVDSDTIFFRPQIFVTRGGKKILNILCNLDYNKKLFVAEALDIKDLWIFDFVAHHMLVNKPILQEMKGEIERIHGRPWYIALSDLAKKHKMGFSEYDMYAAYALNRYPQMHKIVAGANMLLYRNRVNAIPGVFASYGATHKSLSVHHHFLFNE